MSREMQIRSYTVAGQTFTVALEEPWHFMTYTPVVAERIRRAAAGEVLDIEPIRAGDDVPARTYVTRKEELPADMDRYTLDFSQYEPFAEQGQAESLFTLRIQAAYPQWLEEVLQDRSVLQEILRVDNQLPWYYIFRLPDVRTLYEFEPTPGKIAGYLVVDKGDRDADYFPAPNLGPYSTMHQISTVLMILYTYNTALNGTLLMHASTVRLAGKAYVFLGTSGTGKSTHSRLWLENIAGTELLNDDNPVIRVTDQGVRVYGSPWSGKTPCYRKVEAPIGGIVRLEQAPKNEVQKIAGIKAYANVIASAASIRWRKDIMDALSKTAEAVVTLSPCWHLKCLPDADAALTCQQAVIA